VTLNSQMELLLFFPPPFFFAGRVLFFFPRTRKRRVFPFLNLPESFLSPLTEIVAVHPPPFSPLFPCGRMLDLLFFFTRAESQRRPPRRVRFFPFFFSSHRFFSPSFRRRAARSFSPLSDSRRHALFPFFPPPSAVNTSVLPFFPPLLLRITYP